MKPSILSALAATAALGLLSCDKPDNGLASKLDRLEKQAAEATERQRQLEAELAEQKLVAERDAIERERTLIEQERIAMADSRNAQDAAAAAELAKRQAELEERERRLSATQENLNGREQALTGLEGSLSKREMELAGREPLRALPATRTQYVSGPTGDFSNFYEPLGAYGSWFNTNDYGYVYQPSVVRDSSWRPYTRGRWAFTNQGWTWVSTEPFGWACYHYGRWTLLRNVGWVWVPGSEWAPSWVTWRESPGYVGWAPLPPETLAWRGRQWDSSVEVTFGIGSGWFSFVSYRNFGNNIQPYCLPVVRNTILLGSTRNITQYRVTDNRIFVGGPRYETVCESIGRPFPIHHLRMDERPDFGRGGRGGRQLGSHFRGDELEVVAPRMDADWNQALRPSRINRDLGDVAVERSHEIPEDVRRKFRDRRNEETKEAERIVDRSGGREHFERKRRESLEKSREELALAERNQVPRRDRGPDNMPGTDRQRPQEPPAAEIPDRPTVSPEERPGRPGRPNGSVPIPTLPEPPAIPGERERPGTEIPERPSLPPGVTPAPEGTDTPPGGEIPERPSRPERPNRPERPSEPVIPSEPERPSRPASPEPRERNAEQERIERVREQEQARLDALEAERPKGNDLREQMRQGAEKAKDERERALREQQEEMRRKQEQEEAQKVGREREQARRAASEGESRKGNDRLEQMRQGAEKAREERERALREQQAQQQREEAVKRQQEQQEAMRRQQEEAQRQQQEQQEKMRQQQEQQQREEAVKRQQQEQQERMRQQEEQQQRMRQQQEQQQREEAAKRQQQEQQERARQQQEEQQQRARQQQEQQERMREQQQERSRQEQQERSRQEQQERGRQEQQERQREQGQ